MSHKLLTIYPLQGRCYLGSGGVTVYHSANTLRQVAIYANIHPHGQFKVTDFQCLWTVGGSRTTQKKPTQTRGEHANSTQKHWD